MIRRVVPYTVLPLALIACCLGSAPWLRAFPASVAAVPLFGSAVLSVLLPVFVIGIGVRKLWITFVIDVAGFVFVTMLVALHEPSGFGDLYNGLVHGPSEVLSFALPLVSPRTLLVAPVALCWISGAIIGECIGRAWHTVLPYVTLLITFGLAYAGTARGISSASDGRRYDTILAGSLLLVLLLLRVAQAWVEQDQSADTTQPEGLLPLRSVAIGTTVSVVIALLAAAVVQSAAFSGTPRTPQRIPPLDRGQPLTPLSFVTGLRPADAADHGTPLFDVSVDQRSSPYISIASVDSYDGDGWSFDRTFRPSGGLIPADTDPALRTSGRGVTQQYTIDQGAMTSSPWMPFVYRAQNVSGVAVDVDPVSGMIVPNNTLHAGQRYTVHSDPASTTFERLSPTAVPATSAPAVDAIRPPSVSDSIDSVVRSLEVETKVSRFNKIAFLQALSADFRTSYGLAGAAGTSPATRPAGSPASSPARTPGSPTAVASVPPSARTGGTSFADVLASILGNGNAGTGRSATPEQYATLVTIVARAIGVPARVATGFRIPSGAATTIAPGTYSVTTAQAWTWVEIPIKGKGWVVLDASPRKVNGTRPPQSIGAQSSVPASSPLSNQPLVTAPASSVSRAVAPPSRIPGSRGISALAVVVIVLAGLLGLAALALLVPLVGKRLRLRRRRRAGDPRLRLIGAWQESLDVLAESGLPRLTSLTSAEVAAATTERFGDEPGFQARQLGEAANLAVFSPTSWIGPAEADAAWRTHSVLRRTVRGRLPLRARVGASLRYHRDRRTRPVVGPSSWSAVGHGRTSSPGRSARGRHRAH